MAEDKDIDALVKLLDQQMVQGSKHVNVKCDDPSTIEIEKTTIQRGMDCDSPNSACRIPNMNFDK